MPEFDEAQDFTGAVLFCPVCCTNHDAEGWGEQTLHCNNCDTKFTVFLEQEKVAQFAISG